MMVKITVCDAPGMKVHANGLVGWTSHSVVEGVDLTPSKALNWRAELL